MVSKSGLKGDDEMERKWQEIAKVDVFSREMLSPEKP
ncbi:hypothetical protein Golax_025819, partial [Gossypium laxum]|nr:hypothetical protein [Gossypium laxum]